MEAFLAALENTAIAEALRFSRWGYAAVNTLHIFGFALLVGAILPFNLRLLGIWRGIPRRLMAQVLIPTAAAGLGIAIAAGLLLFSVRATEYAALGFLQAKLALVAAGTVSALHAHRRHGLALGTAGDARLAVHAVISLVCWLGALTCGRLIAFADM